MKRRALLAGGLLICGISAHARTNLIASEADTLPSELINKSWTKSLRFIVNRGPNATNFLDEFLTITDPKKIIARKDFTSFKNTRLTFMTYELRSAEVYARAEKLAELGCLVRVVADAATYTLFNPVAKREFNRWPEARREYYMRQYDLDHDGDVGPNDVKEINDERDVSNRFWEKFQKLATAYPRQIELVSPPYEMVPADESMNYPRMTHFKVTKLEFRATTKSQDWKAQVAMISSANLTDSCLSRRISMSRVNRTRYLSGGAYNCAKGSEGNIQFGAVLQGESVLQAIEGPVERWIDLYRGGKHFDEMGEVPERYRTVIFDDGKSPVPTSLQAFYSEGTRIQGRPTTDPVAFVSRILMQPENELKVAYESHFVMSHLTEARLQRLKLSQSELEDFAIFVDANFATEAYSALPAMFFAANIQNLFGVLPGRAIQDAPISPASVDWQKNVYVFQGDRGVFGAKGDKLHSKVSYYEYLDGEKVRHYLVVFGSANKSTKAGRMNADGLLVLDSTDPEVARQVRPYFESLKTEARMRPFGEAWLERRLLEILRPDPRVFAPDFIRNFALNLGDADGTAKLKVAVKKLHNAGGLNAAGGNFLNILSWFMRYGSRKLDWTELSIALFLAKNGEKLQPGVVADLRERWMAAQPRPAALRDFRELIRMQKVRRTPAEIEEAATPLGRIIKNCEGVLARILPDYRTRGRL